MRYLLLFLVCFAARAGDGETRIDVNPNVYPPSAFQGKADKVGAFPKSRPPESVPDKPVREKIFAKVPELRDYLNGFDELDRDLLLLRAKNHDLTSLKAKYPKIPERLLARLRTEARMVK